MMLLRHSSGLAVIGFAGLPVRLGEGRQQGATSAGTAPTQLQPHCEPGYRTTRTLLCLTGACVSAVKQSIPRKIANSTLVNAETVQVDSKFPILRLIRRHVVGRPQFSFLILVKLV
jgi:hypothetical protein